ncbi:unknown [Prevotella sp. CAG:1058]|nr:unknown [Prevotella sp. CAG:1058]
MFVQPLLPFIFTGISQFQTFCNLLKPYSMATFICIILRVITISYVTYYFTSFIL